MALEILPDLIISDVMMPEIDGLELCRMVKGAIELCHIPFILLTAKTGEENQLDGYDCGADAYLEKPFNPIKLQRKVHNILVTADSYARRLRNKATISFDDGYLCSRDRQLLESIRSYILEHLSEERLSILDITRNTGISRTLLHLKLRGGFTYFQNAKQVSRYLGICPTYQLSGISVNIRGHINRNGDAYTRGLLYVAAWTASRFNAQCKEAYTRLRQNGKSGKLAMIAVANKLVRQAFAVVVQDKAYIDGFVSNRH